MKLTYTISTLVALSAASVFRAPLDYDDIGRLTVLATLPDGCVRTQNMRLTLGSMNVISGISTVSSYTPSIFFHSIESRDLRPFFLTDETAIYGGDGTPYLTMGYDSRLVQRHGPVSVIKNRPIPELMIGGTFETFNATCDPGSIVHVNGSESFHANFFSKIDREREDFGSHLFEVGSRRSLRMTVPQGLFNATIAAIERTGAHRDSHLTFTNCTAQVLANLPDIEVRFTNGGIVLLPEDYVVLDSTTSTCRLEIDNWGSLVTSFWFNPLMLAETNVRVSSSGMIDLCASRMD